MLSLSPDGRYLAYDVPATDVGSPRDIIVLATDGSQETTVVQNPANDSFPLWSPDGSHLLVPERSHRTQGLWMVPIDNGRDGDQPLRYARTSARSTCWAHEAAPCSTAEPVPAAEHLSRGGRRLRVSEASSADYRAARQLQLGSTWSHDGRVSRLLLVPSGLGGHPDRSARGAIDKTGEERTLPLPTRVRPPASAWPKWFPTTARC